jgi:hypothetical protein
VIRRSSLLLSSRAECRALSEDPAGERASPTRTAALRVTDFCVRLDTACTAVARPGRALSALRARLLCAVAGITAGTAHVITVGCGATRGSTRFPARRRRLRADLNPEGPSATPPAPRCGYINALWLGLGSWWCLWRQCARGHGSYT